MLNYQRHPYFKNNIHHLSPSIVSISHWVEAESIIHLRSHVHFVEAVVHLICAVLELLLTTHHIEVALLHFSLSHLQVVHSLDEVALGYFLHASPFLVKSNISLHISLIHFAGTNISFHLSLKDIVCALVLKVSAHIIHAVAHVGVGVATIAKVIWVH